MLSTQTTADSGPWAAVHVDTEKDMNEETMTLPPLVSIVVPVFNDAETIAASVRSALNQTLDAIEILVVDDCSTDDTVAIVEELCDTDDRVQLFQQTENSSAFQARLRGISEASSPFVMFLDGDDELDKRACATAASIAESSNADIVQFGVSLLWANSKVAANSAFEKRLQPKYAKLDGEQIVLKLFPAGQPAGGQLWKYLFRTEILKLAYSMIPDGTKIFRANDFPIAYLSAALAKVYVSIPEKLYRYHFQRGASGHAVTSMEQVDFQMVALDSVDSIKGAVDELTYFAEDPQSLLQSYKFARRSIIANVLRYLTNVSDEKLRIEAISQLEDRVSRIEVVRAAATFQPRVLESLPHYCAPVPLRGRVVKNVLLTTSQLTTGGVSAVLLTQARMLSQAGYGVTIVAQRPGSDTGLVPEGVTFYQLSGNGIAARLDHWAEICSTESIDVAIEHRVAYSRQWNMFALMSRACGVSTIGWVHSFAGRSVYELNEMNSFMRFNAPILSRLVVLSPLDVAFWKLRGMERTSYLPNPPSPLLLENGIRADNRQFPSGPVRLVWVGRLDQHTKQVLSVLDIASELVKLEFEFSLSVVGPEWRGMTTAKFNAESQKRGLGDRVVAVGPLVGDDLVKVLDQSDAFIGTSVIEGYQLTLIEAQSRGLPVFMYEMPWLLSVQGNAGIVSAPQGDAKSLARGIVEAFSDANAYTDFSQNSLTAASRSIGYNFASLYEQLIHDELPDANSPKLTWESASEILEWTLFYAERNAGIRAELESSVKSTNGLRRRLKESRGDVSRLETRVRRLRRQVEMSSRADSAPPVPSVLLKDQTREESIAVSSKSVLRRYLQRIKSVVYRGASFGRSTEGPANPVVFIERAELVGSQLVLLVTPDARGFPAVIDAVREVDGVEERHSFTLTVDESNRLKADLEYSYLRDRRWLLRATYMLDGVESEVTLPFSPGALRRSEGMHRMRTPDSTTLQIVEK